VLTFGEFAGAEVVFLARHGYGHTLSPHEIKIVCEFADALREVVQNELALLRLNLSRIVGD